MAVGDIADKLPALWRAYADLDGLTGGECTGLGFSTDQCTTLVPILNRGIVREQDRAELTRLFSAKFTKLLAGSDGMEPLRKRAEFLASCSTSERFNKPTRFSCIDTLTSLRPPEKSTRDLAQGLKDPDPAIQAKIATGLGKMGGLAAPAVPELIHAVSDEDLAVVRAAAEALGEIGDRRAVEPLLALYERKDDVEGNDFLYREALLPALIKINPPGPRPLTNSFLDPGES